MLSFVTNAQNGGELQKKLMQTHEKFSEYSRQINLLSNYVNFYENNKANPEVILKNATAAQKLDSIVSQVWNSEEEIWQNEMKQDFIYNSEMKNTEYLEKEWNIPDQEWETWYRTEIEYNNEGKISSIIFHSRDVDSHDLIIEDKIEAFYGEEGKLDSTLHYSIEADQSWTLDLKQILYYNSSGKMIKREFIMIDDDSGEQIGAKYIFTYNDTGNMEKSSVYYYNEEEEILFSETYHSYDASGKRTLSERWELNFVSHSLEKDSRTGYEYNASGVSTITYSEWDDGSQTWLENEKDEYVYSSTDFSDVAFPDMFQFYLYIEDDMLIIESFNKMITGINTFEMIEGNWEKTNQAFFYYSEGITNINVFDNVAVSMYPNPASDRITFRWSGNYEQLFLEIFQITGAKVMELYTFSDRPVPVHQLDSGVYLFKLTNGKQIVQLGKMIKK
jgi:hypothetical protein